MRYDTSEDITYELDINIILCLDIRDSIISNSEHLQMYLSHKICLYNNLLYQRLRRER